MLASSCSGDDLAGCWLECPIGVVLCLVSSINPSAIIDDGNDGCVMASENLCMGEGSRALGGVCSELRWKGEDEVICTCSVYDAGTMPVAEASERA